MAKPRKQGIITGNGTTNSPILASGNDPTEGQSATAPSQKESASIKPVSLAEALSLLQTDCYDLRSMGCTVQIAARKNRLYAILEMPSVSDTVRMENGHILLRDRPVILAEEK